MTTLTDRLRAVNADPATVAAIVEWLREEAIEENGIARAHEHYFWWAADALEAAANEAHNG